MKPAPGEEIVFVADDDSSMRESLDAPVRSAGTTASDRAIPVIFITSHGDIPMTLRAMKAGAVEFLPKPFGVVELLARRSDASGLRALYAPLTPRERDVMRLVVQARRELIRLRATRFTVGDGWRFQT